MNFINNKVILAPMAGITEKVFRSLCKENGADIVVSEMVSAEGLFYGSKATIDLMKFREVERPIGIQLFGSDPDHMARAAVYVQKHIRPDFIDLNSGCPVPKVVKKNGGAALLQNASLFEKILKAMVKEVSIPVTVKIRSGWKKFQWVDIEFARIAQDCGVAALTVHPRSQTMGFGGHSFWERIAEVKKSVSIPVIGNGDINNPLDAIKMVKETGCDSIMIGRGAYGNPWIFSQVRSALQGGCIQEVSYHDKLDMAIRHIDEFTREYGERCAIKEMKRHIAWYIKGMPGASQCRDHIFRAQTIESLASSVSEIRSQI
ncbi:MAG TPA: tRNA dihydrouridine synthase DusB [Chitinispirillaceae bacterium]|nr:tRNA dihydrouridine synthase DusB [Chitinispirillaceae bacterium]